jgi:hypothetical protein
MVRRTAGRGGCQPAGAVLALFVAVLAGCGSPPPNAAARLSRVESEPSIDLELSPAEQAEVVAAMKSMAVGHTPIAGESPTVQGMRWSDIPAALAVACDEPGVEMVVVKREQHEWGDVFQLRTAEDRPARVEVRRTGDDRLYEATATIGRFNFETDEARARLLLRELGRAMRKYGEKRRLPES